MPGLNDNEKVVCKTCDLQTTKKNIVCHKTRCSGGTFDGTKCPNISATSQTDLNYHIAEKHPRVRAKNT